MRWFSSASDLADSSEALDVAAQRLRAEMRSASPDLLLLFASQHHLFHYGALLPKLHELLAPRIVLGCSAGAVIGGGLEIENRPGLALTAVSLPQTQHRLVHVRHTDLPDLDGSPQPWRDLVGIEPAAQPQFIILADPYSIDASKLLQGLDFAYPDLPKVGGLASGAQGPGGNALFLDDKLERDGAAILALTGNVAIDTIVAQGCRPIGSPLRITASEGHLIQQLDGDSPLEKLQGIMSELSDEDRQLAQRALFVGIVMDELREEVGHGDFLIRNILGMHRESGAIAIGSQLRTGQTMQFHLRDGNTASQELDALLRQYKSGVPSAPAGALLFSCLGRGQGMFGEADHDSRLFREDVAPVPIGGFFCNGEIGPVSGRTYLHGYTSAFGIFRSRYKA